MMRTLWVLMLATGLAACQTQGPESAKKPAVNQMSLPTVLQSYSIWPEVTDGPRMVLDARQVRLWTLCRAPRPGELQPSGPANPHGNKFTRVYADPGAWPVMRGKERWAFKPGTAIVKTKGVQDPKTKKRTDVAIGAMIKREKGYDTAGGDWEYVYAQLNKGKVASVQRGKIESCKACHGPRKTRDHLYMPYLKSN